MSTLSYAAADSATMLRRNLRHMLRYPSMTLMLAGMPVVFLLIFVYVFGGTLGSGLGHVPAAAAPPTSATWRPASSADHGLRRAGHRDLGGHGHDHRHHRPVPHHGHLPLGGADRARARQPDPGAAHASPCVIGVALAIGFRPTPSPLAWLAVDRASLAMTSFALTWLSVALGLVAKTVEAASNLPMFLMLLPFLGSGFVPTGSMPTGLRWFAEYQPFTPVTETLRGLLSGGPVGSHAIVSVAWCVGIALVVLPLGPPPAGPPPGPLIPTGPEPQSLRGLRFRPLWR